MSINITKGFVLKNNSSYSLEAVVYNTKKEDENQKFIVVSGGYSEGKLLEGFTDDCKLRFEVFIKGEEFPAITLSDIRYNKNGDAYIIGINEISNTFIFGVQGTGYTRVHFYNSAAVVSSFEIHLYPGGDLLWESSDKAVGQSADYDMKNLGLKDLSMVSFHADVNWGADSDAGPILYSKSGDKVAGYELLGTAFETWLSAI
ncbi:MAG: hypothetical protein ACRCXT_03375 [Paraclostridium sp.]